MPPVKTKPIDTSTTNPAEFLAGGSPVPVTPIAPAPSPETPPASGQPAPTPGTSVPVVSVAPSVPTAPEPESPNRPGLEAPVPPPLPPDPFVLLGKFATGDTYRNMRALPVPGGCIVRITAVRGTNFAETICFVPGVKIENLTLVLA